MVHLSYDTIGTLYLKVLCVFDKTSYHRWPIKVCNRGNSGSNVIVHILQFAQVYQHSYICYQHKHESLQILLPLVCLKLNYASFNWSLFYISVKSEARYDSLLIAFVTMKDSCLHRIGRFNELRLYLLAVLNLMLIRHW